MTEVIHAPKRQQILTAALQVFAEKGFHNAKIEEIAQLAQVGKGTVYEYFQSKKQLFQEMLKAGMTAFEQALEEELLLQKTTKGKLEVLVEKTLELGYNYRPLAKIAFMEANIMEGSFREWMLTQYNTRIKLIESIIQEGIDNREVRKINAKLFTSLFYASLGALHSPFSEDDLSLEDSKGCVAQIIDYVYHGIAF